MELSNSSNNETNKKRKAIIEAALAVSVFMLLVLILSLLNSSVVGAAMNVAPYPDTDPFSKALRIYHMDNNCNDALGVENCDPVEGSNIYNASETPFSSGYGLYCNGTDYTNLSFGVGDQELDKPKSFSFWIKPQNKDEVFAATTTIFGMSDDSNYKYYRMNELGTATNRTDFFAASANGQRAWRKFSNTNLRNQDGWKHVVFSQGGISSKSFQLWVNGTNMTTIADQYPAETIQTVAVPYDYFLCGENLEKGIVNYFKAYIDDFIIFNDSLTKGEILTLLNGNYSGAGVIDVNITYPGNGSLFGVGNQSYHINVSFNHSGANCSITASGWAQSYNSSYKWGFVNTTALSDGAHILNVSCSYMVGGQYYGYDDVGIFIDSGYPAITWNTIGSNNSIIWPNNGYINLSCSDTNLYDFEGVLYNSSGGERESYSYKSIAGSSQSVEMLLNESLGATGSYKVITNCSDAHTANDISGLKTNVLLNGVRYEYEGVILEEKALSGISLLGGDVTYRRLPDRIVAVYNLKSGELLRSITCSQPFRFVSGSNYRAHLLCGKMWIDSDNAQSNHVYLEKISAYEYNVRITGLETGYFETESVGLINTIEVHRGFTFDNTPPVVTPNTGAGATAYYNRTFSLNYTAYDVLANLSNCSLYVNGKFNQTNAAPINFSLTIKELVNLTWAVKCYDYGIAGNMTLLTIEIINYTAPIGSLYNVSLLGADGQLWFNLEYVRFDTTAGVFVNFFIFACIVLFLVLGIIAEIPLLLLAGGALCVFYGIFLFVSLSVIVGVLVFMLGVVISIVGVLAAL